MASNYNPFENFAGALDNLGASLGRTTNYKAYFRDYFHKLDCTEDTRVEGAPTSYRSYHNSKSL